MLKVSVALATYNGEKYIKEQVESILQQLNVNDEIIVSDNYSTDNTVDILKSFNDCRIKIFYNKEKNVVSNFNNALKNCTGDLIFLCDQDDIWLEDKVASFKSKMQLEVPEVAISNAEFFNENGVMDIVYKAKRGYYRNLLKNSFVGAFMCVNKKFLNELLPINSTVCMHDVYIVLLAEKLNYKVSIIEKKLIMYRRHTNNATTWGESNSKLTKKIKDRINLNKVVRKKVKEIKKSNFV